MTERKNESKTKRKKAEQKAVCVLGSKCDAHGELLSIDIGITQAVCTINPPGFSLGWKLSLSHW